MNLKSLITTTRTTSNKLNLQRLLQELNSSVVWTVNMTGLEHNPVLKRNENRTLANAVIYYGVVYDFNIWIKPGRAYTARF